MPRKQAPRDLDAEFATLLPLYKENREERVKEFAVLFISTLQAEKQTQLWTELSTKFPMTVRLWAMQNLRKSMKSRLNMDAESVARWAAVLDLQMHDSRLAKIKTEGEAKEAQNELVTQCLDKCAMLLFKTITATPPASISELRQVLDSAYEFPLQIRILERNRATFMKSVPGMFNRETFHLFKEGVCAGKLHDKMVVNPSEETRAAYYAHIDPPDRVDGLSHKLRGEIVSRGSLADSILCKYPLIVQKYVLGDLQCRLVRELEGRIPMQEIRATVARIKDELNPDTEADTKVALLKNLRSTLVRMRRSKSTWLESHISNEVQILPAKILVSAIRAVDPEAKPDLKAIVTRLLHKMPPHFVLLPLKRYGVDITSVAPAGFEKMVERAIDEYKKSV